MNSRTKKLLTIIVLGLAFVGWRASGIAQRLAPAPSHAESTPPEQPAVEVDTSSPRQIREAVSLTAEQMDAQLAIEDRPWGRDPFDASSFAAKPEIQPVTTAAAPPKAAPPAPTVKFNGVSRKGTRWLAAVDGAIVGVDDVIQEKYRVATITNSSLTLVCDGWAYRFNLGEKSAQVRPWTENP